ncbi:hypothetical protein P7K49_011738, partial [Saguinus oedipus]
MNVRNGRGVHGGQLTAPGLDPEDPLILSWGRGLEVGAEEPVSIRIRVDSARNLPLHEQNTLSVTLEIMPW